MVVRRGVNDQPSLRWPRISAAAAASCASSSTWTSARPTAGVWTTSSRRRDHHRDQRTLGARAGRAQLPRRGRDPLPLPRRQGRDRGNRIGHRSAAPTPEPACRPTASSTPACSRRLATTSGRCCATAQTTKRSRHGYARSGRSGPTATPSCAGTRRSSDPRSRCPTSAAEARSAILRSAASPPTGCSGPARPGPGGCESSPERRSELLARAVPCELVGHRPAWFVGVGKWVVAARGSIGGIDSACSGDRDALVARRGGEGDYPGS
jgi:hypothetical protein